eukprot:scaffold6985_cov57-Phaeocystis_antarctica.AAC.2
MAKNAKIAPKWGSNPIFRHLDRTFRTRAWRVAPCRRPAAPYRKNHTKCVPSHLILADPKNRSRLTRHDFAYVTMAQRDQRGSLSPRLNTPLWSSAPDLSPLSVQGQCRCPGNLGSRRLYIDVR